MGTDESERAVGTWQALSVVATVMAVIAGLSTVLVYVRGSWAKARIEALQEHNRDLTERVAYLEHSEDELQAEVTELRTANATFKELVTQRAKVDDVIRKLDEHHKKVIELWRDVARRLERLGHHE